MMDIASIERGVRATDLPLDRLAASTQVPEKDKVAEVSRKFEAVLLHQVLSQAHKPLFKSALLGGGGGATRSIYQDMITQQLADRISQGGTFGFAKALQAQMTFPEASSPAAEPKPVDDGADYSTKL